MKQPKLPEFTPLELVQLFHAMSAYTDYLRPKDPGGEAAFSALGKLDDYIIDLCDEPKKEDSSSD
jgi:hypothetical protein